MGKREAYPGGEMGSLERKNQKWTIVIPIYGLELPVQVKGEFKVDKVTFVSRTKLPAARKRLKISKKIFEPANNRFLLSATTFGVAEFNGTISKHELELVKLVREELQILAASQLGYIRRSGTLFVSSTDESRMYGQKYLFLGQTANDLYSVLKVIGLPAAFCLDMGWSRYAKASFFSSALSIVRGKTRVSNDLKDEIRRALVLIGKSICSKYIHEAFLWNMIAFELLLIKRGEAFSENLPKRVEAFIGWVTDWTVKDYEKKIRKLYSKRCSLVHEGVSDGITCQDLNLLDLLLENIILNIVRNPRTFQTKDDIVRISNILEARKFLGLKTHGQPKKLRYISRAYSISDFHFGVY